jgi:steroid delta-isomerase-like uncharacterized protein
MPNAASIARDYIEGWNKRDWDGWRKLLHAEYTYTGGDGQTQKGPQIGLDLGQMYAAAFPNGKLDIKHVHAVSDDVAIVEFVARGTHEGELQGIAPTGRQMELPVCMLVEVRDGQIYAEREYMDMMHMMQQLGVVPAEATA